LKGTQTKTLLFYFTAQGWQAEHNTAGESVVMSHGSQIRLL
jgi:hypothetical protein